MVFDWLSGLRSEYFRRSRQSARRVRRGAKRFSLPTIEALESRVMLAGNFGEVTSFSKISDTDGGFTGPLENGDLFGSSVVSLGDLDGDGIVDMAVGAIRDDGNGQGRGAVYVLFMNADGTVSSHQEISDTQSGFSTTLENRDNFGSALANLGDLDGDGVTDIAVGARQDNDGGLDRGAVYVLFLNTDGTVKSHQKISNMAGNFTAGLNDNDAFGASLSSLGDLDGDGIGDLAVGAPGDNDGGGSRGAVHMLFLNADGTVKESQTISDTYGGLSADLSNGDRFGKSVTTLGDLDGDGVIDLAVGAVGDDDGGTESFHNRGAVYVLFLNPDGTVKAEQKISDISGSFSGALGNNDEFGDSLTGIGDLDGDGVLDLAVGTPGDDDGMGNNGAVYILFLNTDGTVKSHQKISDTEGNFTATLNNLPYFGSSVANLGDLNGDGLIELAVGSPPDDAGGINRGSVYILSMEQVPPDVPLPPAPPFGEVTEHRKLSDWVGNFTANIDNFDAFGSAVAQLGDLDGDGIVDLAVGAIGDDDTGSGRGAVYVLFLNADGTIKSHQKISRSQGNFTAMMDDYDNFGESLTNLGDLDGDGVVDLAVGAKNDDDGGTDRGAVYVLFLNSDGTVKSHQKIGSTQGSLTATLDDNDRFGSSLTNLGDLDDDGVTDLVVGATGDDDGGSGRGAAYVLFLNADGTVKSHQKISDTQGNFTAVLENSDRFGTSVASPGDLNADGVPDLAIGATGDADGGTGRGAIYILFLNANGTVNSHQKISDTQGNFTAVLSDNDQFGGALTSLGDLDGNGIGDLAVGAHLDDDGAGGNDADRGAVYLLFMNADGTVQYHQQISDTDGNFTGTLDNEDRFGRSLTVLGDLNDDGLAELVVGATGDDDGGSGRGAVYILSLEQAIPPGVVTEQRKISDTAGNFLAGLDDDDFFGGDITDLGDLDGDGIVDLAVGATGDDDGNINRGAVYVLFMNADGTVKSHQKISDTQGNFTAVLSQGDSFGGSLANLGDLDGDGVTDLAVSAAGDDEGGFSFNEGAVYVLFLNTDGTVKSHEKIHELALSGYDLFGSSLANLGDLDGDGVNDLVAGAVGDDDGGYGTGAAYVLFLNSDGTLKSHQKISDTQGNLNGVLDYYGSFGASVASLGDMDGDSVADLAVGADNDDANGLPHGAVYVLFLNTDGTVKSHQKISATEGNFNASLDDFDRFGDSLTSLGDLNGDGVTDLAVGVGGDDHGDTNKGAVYILFLNPNGAVQSHQKISDIQGNFTSTLDDRDNFGTAMSVLGDLDGDGIVELAVGATRDDDGGDDHGAVYILSLAGTPSWIKSQNGVVTVTGTTSGDVIDITETVGGNIQVTFNGITTSVPSGRITSVDVLGRNGFDTLRHLGGTTIPVTLRGGNGNDTIIATMETIRCLAGQVSTPSWAVQATIRCKARTEMTS